MVLDKGLKNIFTLSTIKEEEGSVGSPLLIYRMNLLT